MRFLVRTVKDARLYLEMDASERKKKEGRKNEEKKVSDSSRDNEQERFEIGRSTLMYLHFDGILAEIQDQVARVTAR